MERDVKLQCTWTGQKWEIGVFSSHSFLHDCCYASHYDSICYDSYTLDFLNPTHLRKVFFFTAWCHYVRYRNPLLYFMPSRPQVQLNHQLTFISSYVCLFLSQSAIPIPKKRTNTKLDVATMLSQDQPIHCNQILYARCP